MSKSFPDTPPSLSHAAVPHHANSQKHIPSLAHVVRDTLTAPRQWIESWYGAYGILGAVSSGIIPITVPLMMAQATGKLSTVGYVMGAFNLGAISSPIWGNIADKTKAFRAIFFGGLAIEAVAMAAFPLVHGLIAWFVIALLIGISTAAVATCATLMVVEFHPVKEWTPRIGWLQTFNGAGQAIGLLLAGVLVTAGYRVALWAGAALLLPAIGLGVWALRRKAMHYALDPSVTIRWLRSHGDLTPISRFARVELLGGGILRHFSIINIQSLKTFAALVPTRFGRFMTSIFLLFFGIAGFFAYFPVFLHKSFHISPMVTSFDYAITAGLGVFLYPLAGRWCGWLGAGTIYLLGRIIRLAAFAIMLAAIVVHAEMVRMILAFGSFSLVILAWPVISVSATELTSELSPMNQGFAQGLYNAANAVGTVAGTYAAGAAVAYMQFKSLAILAVAGLLLSLLIDGLPGQRKQKVVA